MFLNGSFQISKFKHDSLVKQFWVTLHGGLYTGYYIMIVSILTQGSISLVLQIRSIKS